LDMAESDFISRRNEKFPGDFWGYHRKSSFDEFGGIFYTIFEYNIPDEVIVKAIEKNNDFYENIGGAEENIFSDEDVAALLSRDKVKITAQFAESTAIVIGDRAFSPYWLYYHTPETYREAGITPQMLQEKLPLYTEFPFTEEAAAAFESKLSEFMGREVSLAQS